MEISPLLKRDCFIYGLIDPDSQLVRYVGKTVDLKYRFKRHLKDMRGSYRASWIKNVLCRGKLPSMVTLEKCDIDQWKEREQFWVKHFRDAGINLTNLTDGGNGSLGLKHTPETKLKMKAAKIGRVITPEWRLNMSRSSRKTGGGVVNLSTGEVFESANKASLKYSVAVYAACKHGWKCCKCYWRFVDDKEVTLQSRIAEAATRRAKQVANLLSYA